MAEITLYRALWEIAYKTHLAYKPKEGTEGDHGPAIVTEDLLCGILQHHFQDFAKVQVFLDYCERSNGLLMYQGMMAPPDSPPDTPKQKVYAYPHQTFQEYMSARHLYMLPDFASRAHELFSQDDRWRVVVMFLGEHICFGAGKDFEMEKLLDTFSPDYLQEPIPATPRQ